MSTTTTKTPNYVSFANKEAATLVANNIESRKVIIFTGLSLMHVDNINIAKVPATQEICNNFNDMVCEINGLNGQEFLPNQTIREHNDRFISFFRTVEKWYKTLSNDGDNITITTGDVTTMLYKLLCNVNVNSTLTIDKIRDLTVAINGCFTVKTSNQYVKDVNGKYITYADVNSKGLTVNKRIKSCHKAISVCSLLAFKKAICNVLLGWLMYGVIESDKQKTHRENRNSKYVTE